MNKFIPIGSLLIFSAISQAIEPEDSLLGTWTDGSGSRLAFYGSSIGQQETAYFQIEVTGSDQLAFNYGKGRAAVYTFSFVSGNLHLNDGTSAMIYTRQSNAAGTCSWNLKQVAGAKALFALDHPDRGKPTIADLAAYLGGAVPGCPHGGLYAVYAERPACNVCGELELGSVR